MTLYCVEKIFICICTATTSYTHVTTHRDGVNTDDGFATDCALSPSWQPGH